MSISRYVMELRRNPSKRVLFAEEKDLKLNKDREDADSLYRRVSRLGDSENPQPERLPLEELDLAESGDKHSEKPKPAKPTSLAEIDLAILDHEHDHDHSHGCGCEECEEENSVLHEPEHSPGYMIKQNLFLISQMAEGLYNLVSENDMLPPWMEQKIITAFNEIQAVHRNAEYAKEEEREEMHHGHSHHEDLEEALSIKSAPTSIGEQNVSSVEDLPLVEEAKNIILTAENDVRDLAAQAKGDHARLALSQTSRKLRDIGAEVNVVVERLKYKLDGE